MTNPVNGFTRALAALNEKKSLHSKKTQKGGMENFTDVNQLRMRCQYVGKRTNALRFCNVRAEERGETKLKDANFYSLPPSNMRFLTDHLEWRGAWAKACEESCGSPFFARQNAAPLIVIEDSSGKMGPPTANLKMCYSQHSEMRARVTLDLDSEPTFHSDDLMDCEGMHKAICGVLQERLIGSDVQWAKEPAVFFYGSTETKERTGHLVFLDVAFRNNAANAFKSSDGKKVKKQISKELDEALIPFGVQSDMSIATSGLRYEFTDKFEKDKSWRKGVALPEACFNCDFEGMRWDEMIHKIDPLVVDKDRAYDRLVQWECDLPEASQPSKKRAVAPVTADGASKMVESRANGTVAERIHVVYPELAVEDIVCKEHDWREGVDLYTTTSRWCPLKGGEHSAPGKVKIFHNVSKNTISVGCFPCESKGKETLWFPSPQIERKEGEMRGIVHDFNERHFVAPFGSRGNNKMLVWTRPMDWTDTFRYQSVTDFNNSFTNKVHYFSDANDKRKRVLQSKMWLESAERMEFVRGTVCAPMGAADGWFNTWRGFHPKIMAEAYELEKSGAGEEELSNLCPILLEHLRVNVCNNEEDLYDFITGWLNFLFTKLDQKSGVALVLSGAPGCGKTYFFEALLTIIGEHHSSVTHDSNSMSDKFAADRSADMRLEVFDEATTHNDKRKRGIINGLITSTKVRQEKKFHDAQTVNSFTNIIICSNYASAVDAIVGERRYQMADVAYRVERCSKKEFFDAAFDESSQPQALAAFYLLCRDYHKKEFHPLDVVQNEALWRNVYHVLEPKHKWWFNCLRYGEMQVDGLRTIIHVTGQPDVDAAANADACTKTRLWDALGNGHSVSFKLLRTSLTTYTRSKMLSNSEVEALVKLGNTDKQAFSTYKAGKRGEQELVISLPTLAECRNNFAAWVQFPSDKIFSVWSVELK